MIYFRQAGKQVEQALGWGSKGVTLNFAKKTLAELKNNYLTASGPVTLKEKRQNKTDTAAEQARLLAIQEQENVTFKAFFENGYLPIQKTRKGQDTWIKETGHAKNWIYPVIGNIPIKNVSSFHIERIKKNLLDAGRTPRTVQYCLATIRQTWNHARRAGIVSGESPTRAVKIDYLRESMKQIDKMAGDQAACKKACDQIRGFLLDISVALRDLFEDHKLTKSAEKEMRHLCGELEQGAAAFRKYLDGEKFIETGG